MALAAVPCEAFMGGETPAATSPQGCLLLWAGSSSQCLCQTQSDLPSAFGDAKEGVRESSMKTQLFCDFHITPAFLGEAMTGGAADGTQAMTTTA